MRKWNFTFWNFEYKHTPTIYIYYMYIYHWEMVLSTHLFIHGMRDVIHLLRAYAYITLSKRFKSSYASFVVWFKATAMIVAALVVWVTATAVAVGAAVLVIITLGIIAFFFFSIYLPFLIIPFQPPQTKPNRLTHKHRRKCIEGGWFCFDIIALECLRHSYW